MLFIEVAASTEAELKATSKYWKSIRLELQSKKQWRFRIA